MTRHELSVRELAAILFEELERDAWGDVDPIYFGMIADGLDTPKDPDDCDPEAVERAQALREVLDRAVKRINPCPNCTVRATCKYHSE